MKRTLAGALDASYLAYRFLKNSDLVSLINGAKGTGL